MKRVLSLTVISLFFIVLTSCMYDMKIKTTSETKVYPTDSADAVAEDDMKSETNAQTRVDKRFELTDLILLMKHYEDFELAETSGLEFMYEDGSQDEEIETIMYVYGRDVEKGKKQAPYGFQMKDMTGHGIYFTYILDTSQQASLYFASKKDAKQFINDLLKQDPIDFEGTKYYVHPVDRDGKQYLHIDTDYDDGQYSTVFVIYPPRTENGFCRMEVEVYM